MMLDYELSSFIYEMLFISQQLTDMTMQNFEVISDKLTYPESVLK